MPAKADASQMDVVTLQRIQMTRVSGLDMSTTPIQPGTQQRDESIMGSAYTKVQYQPSMQVHRFITTTTLRWVKLLPE